MKDIWKFGRTGGEYAGQVLDDMVVSVPYTDQPPLEGVRTDGEPLTIADQMFDPKLNQWIVLMNVLDHNDLNNLKAMYDSLQSENESLKQLNSKLMLNGMAIKQENTALREQADNLAQINSKTILVSMQNSEEIAGIKAQLQPETEGGN
ncbi:hypothetical protein [Enterococcus faecium]|uniref:hypothetical protein n=1 Tax=Enterococcus faecium TaxID=1352 RepID=UPI000A352E12|nr:hypothetical protein [Enterococcus faecium]OTN92392.1 hypothetical protein A5809_001781 [Enterococcus faecium]